MKRKPRAKKAAVKNSRTSVNLDLSFLKLLRASRLMNCPHERLKTNGKILSCELCGGEWKQPSKSEEKVAVAADVVLSIHNGNTSSVEDVTTAIPFLKLVVMFLGHTRERHNLSFLDLKSDLFRLEGFQHARKRCKKEMP